MARKRKKTDLFEGLTWNDLTSWAGNKIVDRGKRYQRSGYVKDLARTPDGSLVAWVEGTKQYAVRVFFEDDELESICTCPYWDTCKHAVAVVVEYLDSLKRKIKIPKSTQKDRRLRLLEEFSDDETWLDEDDDFDDFEDVYSQKHQGVDNRFLEPFRSLYFQRPSKCCGQWIENWRISGRFVKASKSFGNRKKRRLNGIFWQTS
jgi:uncharacterized Zn finger protein